MVTIEDYRARGRERAQRHRQRQAEGGKVRVGVLLPAALLAQIDAARGTAGRAEVVQQALSLWLRRQPAPLAPGPAPAPPPAGKAPRRPRRVKL
jgi:hypothetical protein